MKDTRLGRNTLWITDLIWDKVRRPVMERDPVDGRAMEREIRELILNTLAAHLDQALSMEPGDRPCYVGTLLRYPGRQTTCREYVEDLQKWVTRETLLPGSKRLHMVFPTQMAERAVECGLVLPHQWIATGVGAGFIDLNREAGGGRLTASNKGRPLTDSVLTALVLRFGPTSEGPMASIPVQTVRQSTAVKLWTLASTTPSNQPTERLLEMHLPALLWTAEAAERTEGLLAGGWTGSLPDLVTEVVPRSPRLF